MDAEKRLRKAIGREVPHQSAVPAMLEHCALALQHADMSAVVPELQADAAQVLLALLLS